VRCWRNIRQRAIRERLTDSIEYLAVFEETKKGWPHLHVLARCEYLPQAWLSERADQYIKSPIVDIRAVRNATHAAAYVAKYISKGPGRFEGCKRYWRTRHYQLHSLEEDRDLPVADVDRCWHSRPIIAVGESYERCNWLVAWDGDTAFDAIPAAADTHPPWFDAYMWRGSMPCRTQHAHAPN
jgi:hypothetical protein